MQGLRSADEAHRGHAETEGVQRFPRRGRDLWMIGEAEVVVGAEIEHLALAAFRRDTDAAALAAR